MELSHSRSFSKSVLTQISLTVSDLSCEGFRHLINHLRKKDAKKLASEWAKILPFDFLMLLQFIANDNAMNKVRDNIKNSRKWVVGITQAEDDINKFMTLFSRPDEDKNLTLSLMNPQTQSMKLKMELSKVNNTIEDSSPSALISDDDDYQNEDQAQTTREWSPWILRPRKKSTR